MTSLKITILNTLWAMSFVSTIYMTLKFWRSRKNPLLTMFCMFVCAMDFTVLLSLFYKNDLAAAPRIFCIIQGLVLNFCAYATSMTTLCFAIQIYRFVLGINDDYKIKLLYYLLCIGYPSVMVFMLAIISIKFDSILPRDLSCDVMKPPWVRIIGYTGPSLILSIPGMYLSGRAAWALFCRIEMSEFDLQDQGSKIEKIENINDPEKDTVRTQDYKTEESTPEVTNSSKDAEAEIVKPKSFISSTFRKHKYLSRLHFRKTLSKSHNSAKSISHGITRTAAIRMASFSAVLLLVNLLMSTETLFYTIRDKVLPTGVILNDVVGSLIGVVMFLVFGEFKKLFSSWKKKKESTNC